MSDQENGRPRSLEDADADDPTAALGPAGRARSRVRWQGRLPAAIGPYRIVRLLGAGGMGRVFLAEQTAPVQRQVALKLIRTRFASDDVEIRFRAEQQALARLSHPSIAQMFEAATTEDGAPYFVMELVEGASLTAFCESGELSIDARIRLFLEVCAGVEHAHRRGILHRDLKPANVLVTEVAGQATPKIIDFGIAKALDQPLTDEQPMTGLAALGTPTYMSPESLRGAGDLDTRTDVYALGVMLFELLTGLAPFPPAADVARMLVSITTDDAPRPSARLATAPADRRATAAARRQLAADDHRRRLRGDLDWIVTKAMARDRDQRYGSVAELATDLRRHLRHEPVAARPPTLAYQASRFVRRHRLGVAAAGGIVLALVLGIVGTSMGQAKARRAEAEATREAATALRISDFLVALFELSDPGAVRGEEVTARELLERGAARISVELANEPVQQARMMHTLGRIHDRLGLGQRAGALLEGAVELRRSALGSDHPEVASSLVALARARRRGGRSEAARAAVLEALEIQRSRLGPRAPEVATTLEVLAGIDIDRGRFEDAEAGLELAAAIAEATFGATSVELASILELLGVSFLYRGRFAEAVPLYRRALAVQEATLGRSHVETASTLASLAGAIAGLGRHEEAIAMSQRALAIFEAVYGPQHTSVRTQLSNIGYRCFLLGRYEEARAMLERAVAIDRSEPVLDTGRIASRLTNLGLVYWKLGRLEEALPLFEEANRIRDRVLDPSHPHRATSIWGLANVLRDQGRYAEAEALYREALEIRENALPPDHFEVIQALETYAELLRRTGRQQEAGVIEDRIMSVGGTVPTAER